MKGGLNEGGRGQTRFLLIKYVIKVVNLKNMPALIELIKMIMDMRDTRYESKPMVI